MDVKFVAEEIDNLEIFFGSYNDIHLPIVGDYVDILDCISSAREKNVIEHFKTINKKSTGKIIKRVWTKHGTRLNLILDFESIDSV